MRHTRAGETPHQMRKMWSPNASQSNPRPMSVCPRRCARHCLQPPFTNSIATSHNHSDIMSFFGHQITVPFVEYHHTHPIVFEFLQDQHGTEVQPGPEMMWRNFFTYNFLKVYWCGDDGYNIGWEKDKGCVLEPKTKKIRKSYKGMDPWALLPGYAKAIGLHEKGMVGGKLVFVVADAKTFSPNWETWEIKTLPGPDHRGRV